MVRTTVIASVVAAATAFAPGSLRLSSRSVASAARSARVPALHMSTVGGQATTDMSFGDALSGGVPLSKGAHLHAPPR